EMLHGISDIDFGTHHSCLCKSAVEQLTRVADERFTLSVFIVARLLTHHDNAGVFRPFAENRLRGMLEQRTSFALASGAAERRYGVNSWEKWFCCVRMRRRHREPYLPRLSYGARQK